MNRSVVTFAAFVTSLFAQSPAGQIGSIFSNYQHPDTPGCAVGVDLPEQPEWTAAYGMADLEHGVANTAGTVFEAGSVSKQFTAAAVLLLVESGRVSLDDDIRKYFPEIPVYPRVIMVRNLLDHTSGFRDWGEIESIAGWPRGTREYTHTDVLDILSRQKALNYLPGDQWSYTNSGYNLAAMLVERVSGMTLEAFCRKELFLPLGMTATHWRDDFRKVVPNRAIAYSKRGSEWRQDMPFENVYGNAGLLTTVGDLLKWNRNMASGSFHSSIFDQMQKATSLGNGREAGYGLGLFLEQTHGLRQIAHSGATAGYRAWLGRIPSKNISIAILCNAGSADTGGLAVRIVNSLLGADSVQHIVTPSDLKLGLYRSTRDHATIDVTRHGTAILFDGEPAAIPFRFDGHNIFTANPVYGEDVWEPVDQWKPAEPAQYVGTYASEEAETTLQVGIEGGRLIIRQHRGGKFVLSPTYEDAFFCPLGRVLFLREQGKVNGMRLSGSRVWDLRLHRTN
jgi:CubicO group peptidase (beta-lactamase class C family)